MLDLLIKWKLRRKSGDEEEFYIWLHGALSLLRLHGTGPFTVCPPSFPLPSPSLLQPASQVEEWAVMKELRRKRKREQDGNWRSWRSFCFIFLWPSTHTFNKTFVRRLLSFSWVVLWACWYKKKIYIYGWIQLVCHEHEKMLWEQDSSPFRSLEIIDMRRKYLSDLWGYCIGQHFSGSSVQPLFLLAWFIRPWFYDVSTILKSQGRFRRRTKVLVTISMSSSNKKQMRITP